GRADHGPRRLLQHVGPEPAGGPGAHLHPRQGQLHHRLIAGAASRSDGASDTLGDRMDLNFSAADEEFRLEARTWLTEQLSGDFAGVRGRGGPGDEHALFEERLAWERALGAAGWTCVGWPVEHGGRNLSLYQQVIWFEEYA